MGIQMHIRLTEEDIYLYGGMLSSTHFVNFYSKLTVLAPSWAVGALGASNIDALVNHCVLRSPIEKVAS